MVQRPVFGHFTRMFDHLAGSSGRNPRRRRGGLRIGSA
jgi:hypothetical protein